MATTQQSSDPIPVEQSPLSEAQLEQETNQNLVLFVRPIWAQRRLLVKVAVIAVILSSILALIIKPRFQSTAQLMPPQAGGSNLSMLASMAGSGTASLASDMLGLKTSSALYVGVLNSRTMRDRVIDEVGLMKVYGVPTREDARKMLAASSDIAEDRKSGIISITVTDTDPQRASDTGRAYVRNLNLLLAESNVSSARQERIFLDERLEAVWQELDSAQKEFSEFSSKNSAIDIKEQGRAMVDSAAKLQAQLIAAESEIQGLQQIYASENVRVRAAKARIQELRRRLKDMGGKGLGSLEPEVHESNDQYPSIRQLPLLGVRWADLYRRVRIQETVYEILVRQRELAKVQEAKEAPTVRVLDEPLKPDKKAFPSRRSVVLGFTVGALFFAMIWIVASDAWSRISATDPIKVFVAEVSQELEGTWEHLIVRLPFGIAGRLHCRRAQKAAVVTAPVATSEIVREESLVAPERRS